MASSTGPAASCGEGIGRVEPTTPTRTDLPSRRRVDAASHHSRTLEMCPASTPPLHEYAVAYTHITEIQY
jgi:hypothetical protein